MHFSRFGLVQSAKVQILLNFCHFSWAKLSSEFGNFRRWIAATSRLKEIKFVKTLLLFAFSHDMPSKIFNTLYCVNSGNTMNGKVSIN